tara:strand:- start:5377 stop:5649 length:273 start_codon:yes stop_codon:yes gene_type:complete
MTAEEIYNFIRENPSKSISAVQIIEQHAEDHLEIAKNGLIVDLVKKYEEKMNEFYNAIPSGDCDNEKDALADEILKEAKSIKKVIDLMVW